MKTLLNYIIEKEDTDVDNDKRIDIKFKIFSGNKKELLITDRSKFPKTNKDYQKIEYIYKDKEKGIVIDFLLGFKDDSWQLWVGKEGAVSYDDDPYKDLKEKEFINGLSNAISEVLNFVKTVEEDPDNWVQYYID